MTRVFRVNFAGSGRNVWAKAGLDRFGRKLKSQDYMAELTPIEQARMSEVGFGFEKDLTDESIAAIGQVYTAGNTSDDAQEYIKERRFGMSERDADFSMPDDFTSHETYKPEYTIKGYGIFARERDREILGEGGFKDVELVREYSVPGPSLMGSDGGVRRGTNTTTSEGNALFMLAELNSQIQEQFRFNPSEKIIIEIKGHSRGGVSASELARDLKAIYGGDTRVKIDCVQYDPVPGGTRSMNQDPQNDYSPRSDGAVHPDVVASLQRENKAKYGYESRHDEGRIDQQDRSAVVYSTNMTDLEHRVGFVPQRALADVVILSPENHLVGLYVAREADGKIMKQRYRFSDLRDVSEGSRLVGGIELSHLPDGVYAIEPSSDGSEQEIVLLAKKYTKDEVRKIISEISKPQALKLFFATNYAENAKIISAVRRICLNIDKDGNVEVPSDEELQYLVDAMAKADAERLLSDIDKRFPELSESGSVRKRIIEDVIKEKLLGVQPADMVISPTFPDVSHEIKYAQAGSVKKLQKKAKGLNLTLHEEAIKPLCEVLTKLAQQNYILDELEKPDGRKRLLQALEPAYREKYQELKEDTISASAQKALDNPIEIEQSILNRAFSSQIWNEEHVRLLFEERKYGIAEALDNLTRQRQGVPLANSEQKLFIETVLTWDDEYFEKRIHDISVQNRILDDLMNRNPTKDEIKRGEKFIGKAMKMLFKNQKERILFESYWAAPERFDKLKEAFETAFKECREHFADKVLSEKELAKLGDKAGIKAGKRLLAEFRKAQVDHTPKKAIQAHVDARTAKEINVVLQERDIADPDIVPLVGDLEVLETHTPQLKQTLNTKMSQFWTLFKSRLSQGIKVASQVASQVVSQVGNFFKSASERVRAFLRGSNQQLVQNPEHTPTFDESILEINGVDSDAPTQTQIGDVSDDSTSSHEEVDVVASETTSETASETVDTLVSVCCATQGQSAMQSTLKPDASGTDSDKETTITNDAYLRTLGATDGNAPVVGG